MTKYWWGEEPFEISAIPMCIVFGAVVNTLALIGSASIKLDERALVGIIMVFIWGYFNIIGTQITVKMTGTTAGLNEEFHSQANRVAERSLLNTIEQAIPFFLMLGLMAIYTKDGINVATWLGIAYIPLRMMYGYGYSYHGQFTMYVCTYLYTMTITFNTSDSYITSSKTIILIAFLNHHCRYCEFVTQPNYQTLLYMKLCLISYALNIPLENYMPAAPSMAGILAGHTTSLLNAGSLFGFFIVGSIVDHKVFWKYVDDSWL